MLKVIKAKGVGLVSDLGRWGHQSQGVPVGGVLDPVALAVGNWALGNQDSAACLELMGQFELLCSEPCLVLMASAGAMFAVNRRAGFAGRVYHLTEGDVLNVQGCAHGLWNILCVAGGVDVPLVLGSRSTCLPARFGGMEGRALLPGDVLPCGQSQGQSLHTRATLAMPGFYIQPRGPLPLPVLPGPEWEALGGAVQQALLGLPYTVVADSGRMGYRLRASGGALTPTSLSVRSHAVLPGLLQWTPQGQPIVLMCEAQVTGGYPRLGVVPSCALWKLAYRVPGQAVQFELVSLEQCLALQAAHERFLSQYRHAIEQHLDQR
ncbi:biotin-dependent carboxyltransferase family protein [Limnobacter sp.]|uniref:5-oxoprolinase subunit C family protein n=1 Tax=Limnobacter sp. TaxID=2003368 RepID=UPI003517741C